MNLFIAFLKYNIYIIKKNIIWKYKILNNLTESVSGEVKVKYQNGNGNAYCFDEGISLNAGWF
jgi:hypothetical protein